MYIVFVHIHSPEPFPHHLLPFLFSDFVEENRKKETFLLV
jgi:hypothetical protein